LAAQAVVVVVSPVIETIYKSRLVIFKGTSVSSIVLDADRRYGDCVPAFGSRTL